MHLKVRGGEGKARMEFQADREDLERQELEAPNCQPVPSVYGKLLLVMLLQGDIYEAKFVWKRIPENVKGNNDDLARIWTIGRALILNNPPEVYQALQPAQGWPSYAQEYINRLIVLIRSKHLDLVSEAYSSIRLPNFATLVGLSEAEALKLAQAQEGWTCDETQMVYPKEKTKTATGKPASQAKLGQLTDFISFLEKQ